ncbi:MAG: HTTM domain-containing protein [Planctomycetaceae bacterium]|nr:HTTM domain-containing protein [Planctomycetaceae bacterium]
MNDTSSRNVSARDIVRTFDSFWMKPTDLRILDVVRRCFGVLLFVNIALLWPDRRLFFGAGSWLPADASKGVLDQDAWNLFSLFSDSPFVVDMALLALFLGAIGLVLGVRPRITAVLVFLLLTAVQHANMMLFDAEDTVFRLFAFFLIFVPPWAQLQAASRSLSGDLSGDSSGTSNRSADMQPFPAWPLRLFQLQVCLILFITAIQKSDGAEWLDGTAVYFVLRLDDATRYHLPSFMTESAGWLKWMTWSVPAFEFVVPILIWWPRARRLSLVLVLVFHILTDCYLNLHLFHWIMIVGWLTFVRYDEWGCCRNLLIPGRRRRAGETDGEVR